MRFVTFFTLLFSSVLAFAEAPAPVVAANSWLMLDYTTGQVLASRDADKRIEPASLTKLMTAYITFGALRDGKLKREQEVPVSEKAWKMEGSRMFIQPAKPVTVGELVQGMIVQSGNDACVALAEAIAGSTDAFVHIMNQEAKRLGMVDTHFTNTTGLPDAAHYTTAHDLAILAAAVVRDFPDDYSTYSQKEFSYNNIKQRNRNRLLWTDATVDGIKTGHTDSAGYCLIASAKRGERRIITVVTGTNSEAARAEESLKLLNHGFLFYETVRLYSAGQAVSTLPVWKGSSNELQAGFQSDFLMSVPKDQASRLKVDFASMQPVIAPIAKGQQVGTLKVSLDGRELGEYPVLALQEVKLAGWFGRTWDALRLWIKSL
ncbi:MAG: D-alanyl-D-alanine carboxypeptidase [Zoogloeaceae bacterium]|nr:D-alanyl-D-alanine carboxypeptidase [Zoogloeaceae bacterium]MCP5239502.1 D-alanyl-D-alanine carboxypeptidase [Zoogloeaceae bacterium]MCP5255461.1 D-alanyl-D-alanine carboxypeptidase [Zoogloeaceae bacterium]MCW5615542.1 D-alanyl-D-alanine carboxypeptidase [Rhodocyclaceae bacterium]